MTAAGEIAATARAWLDGLDEAQRARATFPFDSPERVRWTYLPEPREGLAIRDMGLDQRAAASSMIAASLSARAVGELAAVIELETVLGELERSGGRSGGIRRDPELYWFAVFGDPS